MGIFLGRETRLTSTFPEPVVPPFRGANVNGGSVSTAASPDEALCVPTVWACVGLIANAVSMLPLDGYRRTVNVPVRLPELPLLHQPFADMTQAEWMHMLLVSLLLRGNAIGKISGRDTLQRPTSIQLLNPDRVRIKQNDDGSLSYSLRDGKGRETPIPDADVWHVRGMTMPGDRVGMSPIAYAAATLGVDLAARGFARDFFAGGGLPKAVLMSDQPINQEQSRTIKDRLLAATLHREPAILGAGLKYEKISVNPEESQFLLTHQMTVSEVARFFHVPAGMVGGSEGGSMTYANVEQRSLDFLVHCVQPWLQRIEQAISALLPASTYVRFDTSVLLRTDAETQAKVAVQHLAGKVLTPTEVRASLNLPPMTEAQKAEADLVPLTITPLGSAKGLPALHNPPGPVVTAPANDPQGATNAA